MILILSATLAASAAFSVQDPQEPTPETTAQAEQEPQQDLGIWTTDYAAAKEQAAKSSKDLLINFTGSDWCIWCKRLKAEVFDEASFQETETERFVFVELDFPQDKSGQTPELIGQNEALMAEFGVQGFPSIFLCDAAGRPYAQTGYEEGGADSYVEHLTELSAVRVARDAALAKADQAEGAERAAFLAEAIDAMSPELHRHYRAWIEEIIKSGSPEMAERFTARLHEMEVEAQLQAAQEAVNLHANAGEWDQAVAAVDTLIANVGDDLETSVHQQVLVLKGRLLLEKDDTAGAIAALRAAQALDPEGPLGQGIDRMIEQIQQSAGSEETPTDGEQPGRGN